MSAESLLTSFANAGIKVTISGDQLRLTGKLELLTDGMKETLREHKPALLALFSDPNHPAFWLSLAATDKTDLDVDDLDEALFLFAIWKVQKTPPAELRSMWRKFQPYWKQRVPQVAYEVVVLEYGKCPK